MPRAFITNCLITVVLGCPYLCRGEAAADGLKCEPEACCSYHCESSESKDQAPPLPDDCDPDCLCHGAVLGHAKVECPATGDSLVLVTMLELCADPFVDFRPAAASALACHFPPGSTGRDVRALICSLLL